MQSTSDAGYLHLTRVEAVHLGEPLHLRDHQPPGVVRRHRQRQRVAGQRLPLHRDVAGRVGGGAANDRDIDREGLVEQVLLAADLHQLDQVLGRHLIQLAAAETRIGERTEPDPGQVPGLARGDIPVEVRHRAERHVVALDLVAGDELVQRGYSGPVPADDPLDQAGLSQPVGAAGLPVAGADAEHQGQVARLAEGCVLLVGGLEHRAQLVDDLNREADGEEPADGDRVADADKPDGLPGRHDLARRIRPGSRDNGPDAHRTALPCCAIGVSDVMTRSFPFFASEISAHEDIRAGRVGQRGQPPSHQLRCRGKSPGVAATGQPLWIA